jgi:hypothetical protein
MTRKILLFLVTCIYCNKCELQMFFLQLREMVWITKFSFKYFISFKYRAVVWHQHGIIFMSIQYTVHTVQLHRLIRFSTYRVYQHVIIKGTVSRDFRPSVFLLNCTPGSPDSWVNTVFI